MATANIVSIGKGSLAAGASTTKVWNNPPLGKVLGFWVQPNKLEDDELFIGILAFQITKVVTEMDKRNHFIVRVTVKNTGDFSCGFELFQSYLS
jgi:hypothetical protein